VPAQQSRSMRFVSLTTSTVSHLRRAVRAFAEREVAPLAGAMDRQNAFPAALWGRLGQAGLLGITVPPEYGGRGLSYMHHLVCMEELSRVSPAVGLSYAAHSNLCLHNLYRNGNEAQRRRYLPALCAGERVGALAMSEPEAGSDILGAMRCRAEQRGGVWMANGVKKWITNGPEADVFLVYMRTRKPAVGTRPISAFIVERGFPGFHTGPPTDKLGMRGSTTCELCFEDCPIPAENLLGQPHEGVAILMRGLDSERLLLAGGPIGIMQAALDAVLPYVRGA